MATKFKFKIDGKCAVTQLDNGSYSHQGSTAWDIASRDTDSYLGYSCNVALTCKAVNKTYAFTWWQSQETVEFADGSEDYIVIMCGHDEDINAYVGMKINANVRIGNMGAGGNATGKHVHVEFGKGSYAGTWYANSDGVYVLYNAVDFWEATFMDDLDFQTPTDSEVKSQWSAKTALFKYTTDEEEVEEVVEDETVEVEEEPEETEEVEETEKELEEMTVTELLEALTEAIEALEKNVDNYDTALTNMQTTVDNLQNQVDNLNAKLESIKEIIDN